MFFAWQGLWLRSHHRTPMLIPRSPRPGGQRYNGAEASPTQRHATDRAKITFSFVCGGIFLWVVWDFVGFLCSKVYLCSGLLPTNPQHPVALQP